MFDMCLPDIMYRSHDRRARVDSIPPSLSAVRSKLGYNWPEVSFSHYRERAEC